jgi:hypothetical protein
MKLKSLKKSFIGTAVGLVMMFGVTVATANAQYRDYDNRGRSYSDSWSRERTMDYAFKLGYHQAYSEARDARNNGFRGSLRDLPGYHNDGNGYLSYMNYLSDYRVAYRRGYESGANDAFAGRERRFGRNEVEQVLGQRLPDAYPDEGGYQERPEYRGEDGRDRDWRDSGERRNDWRNVDAIAQRNGFQDGLRQGEQDRFRRVRFDYQRSSDYRNALNGYRFEFGNRDRYRDSYREGFRRGYSEGFSRSNDNRNRWPF